MSTSATGRSVMVVTMILVGLILRLMMRYLLSLLDILIHDVLARVTLHQVMLLSLR
jgi:hypothetical protein